MNGASKRDTPVWRTVLNVPVNVERFVDKAHTRGADCVQLDLEDSIPAHEKEQARKLIAAGVRSLARGNADICVRINHPIDLAVRDLEHAIIPGVNAIGVAKTDSAWHLQLLDELVSRLEEKQGMPVGGVRFIAPVETADAYFRLHEIAHALERTAAMALGGEDFALDCEMLSSGETLLHAKQQMIIAARSAGLIPLGFVDSVAQVAGWDAFRAMVRRSRDFGFQGAHCIHPQQVTIVNEEYTPSESEVEYARKLVRLDAEAAAAGRASFELDGKMIDVPIVLRARRLLMRHERIVERLQRAPRG